MSSYHICFTGEETETQRGDLSCGKGVSGKVGCRDRLYDLTKSMPMPPRTAVLPQRSRSQTYRLHRDSLYTHPKAAASPPSWVCPVVPTCPASSSLLYIPSSWRMES